VTAIEWCMLKTWLKYFVEAAVARDNVLAATKTRITLRNPEANK